jgi:hypothetical protein
LKIIDLEDIMVKVCENNRQQTAKLLKIDATLKEQIIANLNALRSETKYAIKIIESDVGAQIGELRHDVNVLQYEVNPLLRMHA